MRSKVRIFMVASAMAGFVPLSATLVSADGQTKCEMTFNMKGWSAFYKTAKGEGTIRCDNGESMAVSLKITGGGITFGKTEIKNGHGKFSEVGNISEVLGSYAAAQAEAGAVKSADAQALTKGEVSLALSGTGSGWNLGVSGAKFTIEKK